MMFSSNARLGETRVFLWSCLVLWAAVSVPSVVAQNLWRGNIIPQEVANSRGLERVWTNQIQINTARDRLSSLIIDRGTIFTVTENGAIQATNAETGVTLWSETINSKGKFVQGLSASEFYVGFTCGSTIYIFNRANGRMLLDSDIPSIPANGLTLGENRAYVPSINGLVYIYDLQPMGDPLKEFGADEKTLLSANDIRQRGQEFINSLRLVRMNKEPISIRAIGNLSVSPVVTRCNDLDEYVGWVTDIRLLTLCDVDTSSVDEKYNVPLLGDVKSELGYMPHDPKNPNRSGLLFAGTNEGFVYAVREMTGEVVWRFPTGEEVHETPIYVDKDVFIITAVSGMYCVDALTGGDGESTEAKWWSPNIKKFVACSKNRVYALDDGKSMVILDRMSGQKITSLPVMEFSHIMTNTQNDRIYLGTETGLIQCLREPTLENPIDFAAPYIAARQYVPPSSRLVEKKEEKKEKTNFEDEDGFGLSGDDEDDDADGGDDDSGFDLGGFEDGDDAGDDDDDAGDDDAGDDFGGFGDDDDDAGDDDAGFGGDDDDDAGDDDAGFGDDDI